ncbi:hypothetical protein D3C80_1887030 [compost metagenome]
MDSRNRQYIRDTYVRYATKLLERKEFDRAKLIIQDLEKLKELDSVTQYTKANILLETAYRQGRSYI